MNEALALQMEDAGADVIIREEVVTDATIHYVRRPSLHSAYSHALPARCWAIIGSRTA